MPRRLSARGQSSVEFLMTYGWAILIILIVFIVAWQWGFFSLGDTVEPGSFGFWGVLPNDYVMQADGTFTVSLLNNAGSNVTVLYYNVSTAGATADCGSCDPFVIEAGGVLPQTVTGLAAGTPGRRFDAYMIIEYNDSRIVGQVFRSSGKIWGNYEQ